MINTVKTIVTLVALVGFLGACSSKTSKDQNANAQTDTSATTSSQTVTQTDVAEGVDTVFYFEFDQSILSSQARAALTIHAESLRQSPKSVRLEGHADERGSREYNMALGERRANAVRDFLVLQGVDASLIETVSYGEERPAVMGSSEGSWAQNRRVELKK